MSARPSTPLIAVHTDDELVSGPSFVLPSTRQRRAALSDISNKHAEKPSAKKPSQSLSLTYTEDDKLGPLPEKPSVMSRRLHSRQASSDTLSGGLGGRHSGSLMRSDSQLEISSLVDTTASVTTVSAPVTRTGPPSFASLELPAILVSKQTATKYIQEAQSRLVSYLSSNRTLARANSDLTVRVRECIRTQKVIEFRALHLSKLLASQSRSATDIDQSSAALVQSLKESVRRLEDERSSLLVKMRRANEEFERVRSEHAMEQTIATIEAEARAQAEVSEVNQLRQSLVNLTTESHAAESTVNTEEQQQFTKNLEQARKDIEALERRAVDDQRRVASLEASLLERDSALLQVEAQISETRLECRTMLARLEAAEAAKAALEESEQHAVLLMQQMQTQLEDAHLRAQDLATALNEEREESDALEAACAILRTSHAELEGVLATIAAELREVRAIKWE